MIREQILVDLKKVLAELGFSGVEPVLEHPSVEAHGDYSTNIALLLSQKEKKNPLELAKEIAKLLTLAPKPYLEKV